MKQSTKIILIVLSTALGLIFGVMISLTQSEKEIIVRKTLPLELTKNLTLQQLSANVEGVVAAKNNEFFIVETNNQQITVYYEPRGLTSFTDKSSRGELKYEDLKIGDKVSGGISIIISSENAVGRTGNRKPGDVIAHHFNVN